LKGWNDHAPQSHPTASPAAGAQPYWLRSSPKTKIPHRRDHDGSASRGRQGAGHGRGGREGASRCPVIAGVQSALPQGGEGAGREGLESEEEMKTLLEEVMRKDQSSATQQDRLILAEMDKAEIIHIQNVADYFYRSTQEDWDISKDFPNLAPPFPSFWLEHAAPPMLFDGKQFLPNPYPGMKVGCLFVSKEPPEGNERGIKWLTVITMFTKTDIVQKSLQWHIAVDENGQVARQPDGMEFALYVPSDIALPFEERVRIEEQGKGWGFTLLCPFLLAISFLHCKNVQIAPHDPAPKTPGKRRSRHAPKIKYHTLQIEPMKKVLREEGRAEETGIKHALHICRGHFKDFSKGKGLFGKYQGMFWWDSQVRGSAERGAVVKDYNINEPKDTENS
jgi:hypothetical protein